MTRSLRTSASSAALLLLACLPVSAGQGSTAPAADRSLPLAGEWHFQLDRQRVGVSENWFDQDLADTIALPRSTDLAKKGVPNSQRAEGRLTRVYPYSGSAWYQRRVDIPAVWTGKHVTLLLERSKFTHAWLDDHDLGSRQSLVCAQVYDLGTVTPGQHRLTIEVENERLLNLGDTHQLSDNTQTNWNGIIGRIELRATDPVWIDEVWAYPDLAKKSFHIKALLGCSPGGTAVGRISVAGNARFGSAKSSVSAGATFSAAKTGQSVEVDLPLGAGAMTWDEFSPALYHLDVTIDGKSGTIPFSDHRGVDAGLRSFTAKGSQFQVNGRSVFLRGKHDACVFPLTGFPPMDKESWLKVMKIIQSYGINHYRCHSWCPPEAAFAAADELGIYIQAELPTWHNYGSDAKVDAFRFAEGERMFANFGNHPSFVMLSLGNELNGSAEVLRQFRALDPRRLYTMSSNGGFDRAACDYRITVRGNNGLPIRGSYAHVDAPLGPVQAGPANTMGDFSAAIAGLDFPMVGHETGQYQVYPDFTEIPKYTGVLQARNFEVARERLQQHGMLDQAADFVRASGAAAALCYRADNEYALRTRGFGGFEILDLQDFPGQGTALVGILNAFLESKGLIEPAAWRESCSSSVVLARFPSYTWTTAQTLTGTIELAHYAAAAAPHAVAAWTLRDIGGTIIASGKLAPVDVPQGSLTGLGSFTIPLARVKAPAQVELEIRVDATKAVNHYPLWVYPDAISSTPPSGVTVARRLDAATRKALADGATVALVIEAQNLGDEIAVPGFFTPDFWCWAMFHNPPGTMGLLIDPKHPALAGFPTSFHSDWQWFEIAMASRPIILDCLPAGTKPIVQVIDNFTRCHRLGLVSEFTCGKGRLLLIASDLIKLSDKPAAQQLLARLLAYAGSKDFKPTTALPDELALGLARHDIASGKSATADASQNGYEPAKAVDGDASSRWCAPDNKDGHWWQLDLGTAASVDACEITWESGADYRFIVEGSSDGATWTVLSDQRNNQDHKRSRMLRIPPTTIRSLRITVSTAPKGHWASIADVRIFSAD